MLTKSVSQNVNPKPLSRVLGGDLSCLIGPGGEESKDAPWRARSLGLGFQVFRVWGFKGFWVLLSFFRRSRMTLTSPIPLFPTKNA